MKKIKMQYNKKNYYEGNKDAILEKQKQFYEQNKDVIHERSKVYRENNKEQIYEQKKIYRENNKEQIRERHGKKETCLCGKIYIHNHKARHERSKKHQAFIRDEKQTAETI